MTSDEFEGRPLRGRGKDGGGAPEPRGEGLFEGAEFEVVEGGAEGGEVGFFGEGGEGGEEAEEMGAEGVVEGEVGCGLAKGGGVEEEGEEVEVEAGVEEVVADGDEELVGGVQVADAVEEVGGQGLGFAARRGGGKVGVAGVGKGEAQPVVVGLEAEVDGQVAADEPEAGVEGAFVEGGGAGDPRAGAAGGVGGDAGGELGVLFVALLLRQPLGGGEEEVAGGGAWAANACIPRPPPPERKAGCGPSRGPYVLSRKTHEKGPEAGGESQ